MTNDNRINMPPSINDLHLLFAELSFTYGATIHHCSFGSKAIWLEMLASDAEDLAKVARQLQAKVGPND